jgi:hypothetical protein
MLIGIYHSALTLRFIFILIYHNMFLVVKVLIDKDKDISK